MRYRQGLAFIVFFALSFAFSTSLSAQHDARAMNYNAHGGGYDTGGIGAHILVGAQLAGEIYRGRIVNGTTGLIVGNGQPQDRTDGVFGIGFDLETGTDSEFVATNLSFDIVSYSVSSAGRQLFNATVLTTGWDWIFNLSQSEFLEADGRRTRKDYNLSLLAGMKVGSILGDLTDLNGFLTTVGFNMGIAADIPMHKDIFQIAPAAWVEMNYHFSDTADGAIFTATDTGLAAGSATPNFDGIVVRSHTLIPPYAFHFGTDMILTPLYVGREDNLINNWRFNVGFYFSIPFAFNAFFADNPGDPLNTDKDGAAYFTLSIGAAYFW